MPILAAAQRRYLFDKSLMYLFSYDLPLTEEMRAPVPGGLKLCFSNLGAAVPSRKNQGPFDPQSVYHVLDEDSVASNEAIRGRVELSRDSAFIPDQQPVGAIEGSIVVVTFDDAIIDSRYVGSLALGPLGSGHFDSPTDPDRHSRVRVFIAPRFETAYPKYKWLTERQCAGFGVLEVQEGQVSRATFDIYAMK